MKQFEFNSLDDLLDCYDRSDVIAIDTLKQAMFYVSLGVQPELVWPKEDEPNRMTFWFLKKKTQYVYEKWKQTKQHNESSSRIRLKKVDPL